MYALFKLALAGSLLLVSAPVETAAMTPVSPELQVVCPVPFGVSMGTAFKVGPNLLLSVKHVTGIGSCYANGELLNPWNDPERDFSITKTNAVGPWLTVDCNGFVKGKRYIARGYARGMPYETSVEVEATGVTSWGFYTLKGIFTFVPGMSGGPVIDPETGKVVGTINVYDMVHGLSGSVELKNTSICAKH